jgi:hypothetical protein
MTTNEVQDTLLSDKEIEDKIIDDALHMLHLWHKPDPLRPNYNRVMTKLRDRYRDRVTKTLTKYNLSGSIYEQE